MERSTKVLLAAVAGLGGMLVAGAAGWVLAGRHPVAIPVIEADSRPVRVKPGNAGGLQVTGADDQVMGGLGSKLEGMAPVAEVPAAQALRAQMPPQPAAPQPAPPPASPPPAVAQPAAAQAPPAQAPVPLPAAAPPQAAASAVRPAPVPATGTMVQLAALDSEEGAQSEWQRLAKRMPDLLGDRRPVVQRADRDGRAVWRVRTGGFSDVAEATAFCARVRSKGGACSIASF